MITRRRWLVAALVLACAGLVYFFKSRKRDVMYSMYVDEVLKRWQMFAEDERRLRVEGFLVPGTLVRLQDCEHRFRLAKNGKEIAVRVPREGGDADCPQLPGTFCEGPGKQSRVLVEGYLEGTAERPGFVAENVLVTLPRFDLGEPLPRCLPIPLAR